MFALRIVCEEVLDYYEWPIVRDGEVVWLIEDEYGDYDHYTDYEDRHMPLGVLLFDTEEEAKAFLVSKDMLWYIKPKSYELVEVKPIYETKIVGWEIK